MQSRRDLPGIEDLKAAGLLDPVDLVLEQMELDAEAESEADQAAEESVEREFVDDDGVLLENEIESA